MIRSSIIDTVSLIMISTIVNGAMDARNWFGWRSALYVASSVRSLPHSATFYGVKAPQHLSPFSPLLFLEPSLLTSRAFKPCFKCVELPSSATEKKMGAQQTARRRWQIGLCASAALVVSVVLFFVFAALVESSRVHKGLGRIAALQRAPGEFDDDSSVDDFTSKGLIDELIKAEVIPTVIDAFAPLLNVSISWPDFDADLGNTGSPSDLQDIPSVHLIDTAPDAWARWWGSVWDGDRDVHHARPQLTLILTDPDAPSRENPTNSEFCHWIATGFPLTTDGAGPSGDVSEMKHFTEIIPYRPPGPPPKTGKHRYVFVALVPSNGTSEKLDLRKPEERARWGYGEQRHGVRQWAHEMGLSVVGANFIYAQDDEQ